MKNYLSLLLPPLLLLTSFISYAGDNKNGNIVLYFNGVPQVNQKALPEAFEAACAGGICAPTTMIKMVDPTNNKFAATLFVWAKDFTGSQDGITLCFTELIEYDFKNGVIYTIGNHQGTCGASMDVTLVPPVISPNNHIVAGGGAGKIVEGTGNFKDWNNGSYIDRVFVELTSNGIIENYTGLYFTLSPPKVNN